GATEVQREEKERQIRGAVVEWKLPVYDVSSRADGYYVIQTSTGNGQIGTFCHVKPKDEYEKKVLVSLKPGQIITCKGIIDGVSMGNIEIDPAIVRQLSP
ncbi:MAG: hypothetical protein P4M13_03500, partial [Alphaproteobacteria bacterium]|nr:hypothetical protein [Alphaproteobacteria bacterium]